MILHSSTPLDLETQNLERCTDAVIRKLVVSFSTHVKFIIFMYARGMIKLCDAVFEARCVAWSRCDLHNLRSQGLICISQSEAKHSIVDQSEAADSLL